MGADSINPGKPPELMWLPVDRLTVDHRYQRTLEGRASRALIEKIAAEFSWRKFQAVTACIQGSGWELIDGQHRVAAARKRLIEHVPATVHPETAIEERAAMFLATNRDRISVTPIALYRSRLAAGEPSALATKVLLDKAGIKFASGNYTFDSGSLKPDATTAINAIQKLPVRFGAAIADRAVCCLADAWRGTTGNLRAGLFNAVAEVLREQQPSEQAEMAAKLTAALRKTTASQLEFGAENKRRQFGGTKHSNLVSILKIQAGIAVALVPATKQAAPALVSSDVRLETIRPLKVGDLPTKRPTFNGIKIVRGKNDPDRAAIEAHIREKGVVRVEPGYAEASQAAVEGAEAKKRIAAVKLPEGKRPNETQAQYMRRISSSFAR